MFHQPNPVHRRFCCRLSGRRLHAFCGLQHPQTIMALKLVANYSKRLGLPSYSSHQFSLTVEAELNPSEDINAEASRLYHTLQSAVDKEIQRTGFIPQEGYGDTPPEPRNITPLPRERTPSVNNRPWKASDKQKGLILKLAEDNNLDLEIIEAIAEELFGTGDLPALNKIQVSGLIDELLARYGKKQRSAPSTGGNRWNNQRRVGR